MDDAAITLDYVGNLWKVGAVLSAAFLLATARTWWIVGHGKTLHGVRILPDEKHLKNAAERTAICCVLCGATLLLRVFGGL